MKPIDFRNATFADLQGRLTGQRARVHRAWCIYGPGTTAEVSALSKISILSFRPRTTELYQMGAIALHAHEPSPDGGIYRARSDAEWLAHHAEQRAALESRQQQLL